MPPHTKIHQTQPGLVIHFRWTSFPYRLTFYRPITSLCGTAEQGDCIKESGDSSEGEGMVEGMTGLLAKEADSIMRPLSTRDARQQKQMSEGGRSCAI